MQSPETRQRISAAAQNRTAEYRAKIGLANRRRSPELRAQISRANREAQATPWDEKSWAQKHYWVGENFEDPGGCEHCGVQWMRLDWASVGHTYTQDRKDWRRLCQRCHSRMDRQAS